MATEPEAEEVSELALSQQLTDRLRQIGMSSSDVPSLMEAFNRSAALISKARAHIRAAVNADEPNADVIGFGSLARHEFTSESDLDYLVVTYGLDSHPGTARRILQHADSLRTHLITGRELKAPGMTGVFGRVISAPDMVERIGLEEDTNHSHTRRILLLEESTSLYRPERHEQLVSSIIDRYLFGRVRGKFAVPRFLLNDIVRYWRTIAVDYQAKNLGHGIYSLRYLKLLISRKLTFASSLVPLAECLDIEHDVVGTHLVHAYQEPSLLRLLRLAERLQSVTSTEHLQACVKLADQFTERVGTSEWREQIAIECTLADPTSAPEFSMVRRWGKELQSRLQSIFLEPSMRVFTEKYLLF